MAEANNDASKPRPLTDAEIVDQIVRNREEAYQRDYVIRDRWLQCYALYRNKADFSDKAPWQSKLMLSKAFAAVKQATANILRLLLSAEQWVTAEPGEPRPELEVLAPYVEMLVLKLANTANARSEIRDALEFGFGIGLGVLKVDWRYDIRNDLTVEFGRDGSSDTPQDPTLKSNLRKEGHLGVTSIDPFHMWFGPRTKGRRDFDWTIEESYADLASLKAQDGFKNLDLVSGTTLDASDMTRAYDKARKDKRDVSDSNRKNVHLLEFYGDLIDPVTSEIAASNQHVIIANRKDIIKSEDNPFWDLKPPYITFSPLLVAGRFPGQGVVEMSLSLLNENNKVAQQMADHISFSVVPMLEVEATALENAEGDLQTGIQPGKVFYRRAGTQSAVAGVQMPQLNSVAFNFQSALDHEIQRSTFITETVQGLTDAKGETTATEVNATQQQSSVLIADIGATLEDMLLAPLAEAIWSRAFQFVDSTSSPTWTELIGRRFGPEVDAMPRAMRISLIQGRYNFIAHGLSRAIQRNQNGAKILSFLQTIGQAGQSFAPLLNMPALFKRYFDSMHLPNPDELLAPNADDVMQRMTQATIDSTDPVKQAQVQAQAQSHVAAAQGDQKAMQMLLERALANHGDPNAKPAPAKPDPTPSESIGYLNLPPEGRVQMAAKAGIHLTLEQAKFNPAPPKAPGKKE